MQLKGGKVIVKKNKSKSISTIFNVTCAAAGSDNLFVLKRIDQNK